MPCWKVSFPKILNHSASDLHGVEQWKPHPMERSQTLPWHRDQRTLAKRIGNLETSKVFFRAKKNKLLALSLSLSLSLSLCFANQNISSLKPWGLPSLSCKLSQASAVAQSRAQHAVVPAETAARPGSLWIPSKIQTKNYPNGWCWWIIWGVPEMLGYPQSSSIYRLAFSLK